MATRDATAADHISVGQDATLAEVSALMRDRGVGSVTIVSDGRPTAAITDRDVALALGAEGADRDEPAAGYAAPSAPMSRTPADSTPGFFFHQRGG